MFRGTTTRKGEICFALVPTTSAHLYREGCPHHGFSELHQLDTFYNALNSNDQDSLNSTAGGNFLDKMPQECLKIIESKSKVHQSRSKAVVAKVSTSSSTPTVSPDVAELKDMVRTLILDKKNQTPAPVKAVEQSCVTCGVVILTKIVQPPMATFIVTISKSSGTLSGNTITNLKEDLKGITTRSGVAYQGPMIPPTSSSSSKVMNHDTEVTKDTMLPTNNGSTEDVQPPVIQLNNLATLNQRLESMLGNFIKIQSHNLIFEPVVAPVSAPMPNQRTSISFPSRSNDERRQEKANDQIEKFYEIFRDLSFKISFTDALTLMPKFASTLKTLIRNKEKLSEMAKLNENCSATSRALIDVYEGEITLRVGKEAITFNLDQTSRYTANYDHMTANRIDVIELACEEYSQEVLGFSNVIAYNNPSPYYDPIVSNSSPTLTPFGDSDFILLEEANTFIAIDDEPISQEINATYYDPEGDILILEALLNSDPLPPLPNHKDYSPGIREELKVVEAKTIKSSIDEPPEVKLKDLTPHLEYEFLEGDDKFPVIITKDLKDEDKATLIKVLKSHKRAIAWKLSDIKGVDPEFCTHKILMEEDYEPTVQSQRRVNPKIHDVIKKEVEKLLDAGLIYPISDSPWVSPVHCVPKKGGITVVKNDDNDLIPTRLVTGWRVCIDYRKLNEATRRDHFPLPFMDQMLERLTGNQYYCFLDGFSSYF
ncbi:hypothetical protein Tco_0355177 [Tanacetum coccineum]